MDKITHCQTVLTVETLEELKSKTHKDSTKDAMFFAIESFLESKEPQMREVLKVAREYLALHVEGQERLEIIKQIDALVA